MRDNPVRSFPAKPPRIKLGLRYPDELADEASNAGHFLYAWIAGSSPAKISRQGLDESELWRVWYADARFTFHFDRSVPAYYKDERRYFYHLMPKGGVLSADGKVKTFKRPHDAFDGYYLDAIKRDPRLVYRGMSWEEWQFIRTSGAIRSRGDYNLGSSQEHHTFFGEDPSTALHYANGFAPWPFRPGHERPGVVIAIDRKHTIGNLPHVPEGERAIRGSLSIRHVEDVWYLVPVEIPVTKVEITGRLVDRPGVEFWGQAYKNDVDVAVIRIDQ